MTRSASELGAHGARIEHASLNAWPALHQVLSDGWLARFCGGFTKRANSVSVVTAGSTPLAEHIDFCAGLYRHQNLRPIFRLTDLDVEPALDDALAARDYETLDPTAVLVAPCAAQPAETDAGAVDGSSLDTLERDAWLGHYTELAESPPAARQLHGALLAAIRLPCAFGVVRDGDTVVACGLAVQEADLVGLFDIVTHPAHRRRGYGERLTRGLVQWGATRGARIAYLQVLEANAPAQRIYERLGFVRSHRYWYRAAPVPASPADARPGRSDESPTQR